MQTETTSTTAVDPALFSEAIRFFYSQASDALKQLREARKSGRIDEDTVSPGHLQDPEIFDSPIPSLRIHLKCVKELEEDLREVRAHLLDYATGAAPANPDDPYVLHQLCVLRSMMEAIYRVHFTVKGEVGRAVTGTPLAMSMDDLRACGAFTHETTVYEAVVPMPTSRPI